MRRFNVSVILVVLAVIAFVLAALEVNLGSFGPDNLVAAGLALGFGAFLADGTA